MTPRADGEVVFARLLGHVGLGLGVYLCVSHPLAPLPAVLAFLCVCGLLMRAGRGAVLCLPAALPVLSLAPWTGWRTVDEFDLLVLAVVTVGYAQATCHRGATARHGNLSVAMVMVGLAAVAAGLLWPAPGGYADDAVMGEGLRVAKSVVWTVLLFPLVRAQTRVEASYRAGARFFAACVAGAVAVCVAVIWERALYPGWLDFSTPYRTVALFWEMHRGGAALDAYLVLLAPAVVWAWRQARAPGARLLVAVFVLAFVYAVLTSFSRGVWAATLGALAVLAVLAAWRRRATGATCTHWSFADVALGLAVVLEVALVFGTGAFMERRLADTQHDLRGRWQHWRSVLDVLQTPQDWLFGVGPGQLPRRWLAVPDAPRRSGGMQWRNDGDAGRVLLGGPDALDGTPYGAYFLTQRIPAQTPSPARVQLEARSERAAQVDVQWCIQHLLYPAACRRTVLYIEGGDWRSVDGLIVGPAKGCSWLCAGRSVLMLAVRTPQATVEIRRASLVGADGDVLRNPRFADGLAFWYPLARANFEPWHIDNLYLEVLIETGFLGLLLFLALLLGVVRRVWHAYLDGDPLAAYYLASISALLALGLLVSLFDMPRAATLFGLFLMWAWFDSPSARGGHERCRGSADCIAAPRDTHGAAA